MAKQLAALLGGGLDLKALAEMLRRQGRGQDTILAHITPQEAALLKSRGGAGTMNPATGLPEFQEEDYYDYSSPEATQEIQTAFPLAEPTVIQEVPIRNYFGQEPAVSAQGFDYTPETNIGQGQFPVFAPSVTTRGFQPSFQQPLPNEFVGQQQVRDFKQEAIDTGAQPQRDLADMLKAGAKQAVEGIDKRTGLGLGLAGLAALQARRGYNQARQTEQQLRQLGQAPREVGQQQLGAGMRGELTPVQQQQLAAFQAQQRQALANTGQRSGTAQQQLAARTTEMQQRGAQDLINQGLKNIGISDQYLQRAILAGYQADANVGSALAEALQAAGYMVAGAPSETPTRPVTTPAQTQVRTALTPPRG